MKDTEDFFAAWGGINGCQSTLGVLLEGVGSGYLGLAAASAAISRNVADRLRLARKGRIAVGYDADVTLVDMSQRWTLTDGELRYRHRISALVGQPMRGAVRRVLSRGRTVIADGEIMENVRGTLLDPAPRG